MKPTIGVLAPRSSVFPNLGLHFTAGARLGLSETLGECDIIFEDIGSGGSKDALLDKMQKLQLQHFAQAQIAFAGSQMIDVVQGHLQQNSLPLLLSNLGATSIPFEADAFLMVHQFGLTRSVELLGQYAAKHLGKQVAVVSGFHESGYGLYNHFEYGLTAADGAIGLLRLAPPGADPQIGSLLSEMEANGVNTLWVNAHGELALNMLKEIDQSAGAFKPHILLSPFGLLPEQLVDNTFNNLSLYMAYPWAEFLSQAVDESFATQIKRMTRQAANPFSLLGYEAGLIMGTYLQAEEAGTLEQWAPFSDADKCIRSIEWEQSKSNSKVPSALLNFTWSNSRFSQSILQEEKAVNDAIVRLGIASGFASPYLCY